MHRGSAGPALAFGIFLAIAGAVRNRGDWQWWPFRVVDSIARGPLTVMTGVLWGITIVGFAPSLAGGAGTRADPG